MSGLKTHINVSGTELEGKDESTTGTLLRTVTLMQI